MNKKEIHTLIRQKEAEVQALENQMKTDFSGVMQEVKPGKLAIKAAGSIIKDRLTPINLVKAGLGAGAASLSNRYLLRSTPPAMRSTATRMVNGIIGNLFKKNRKNN